MRLAISIAAALTVAAAAVTTVIASSDLERTPSRPGTEVYIISPQDGATVASPVRVVFGLRGMGIAPAGVQRDGTGHHHLLIDTGLPENMAVPIPADEQHRHFGGGQTETEIELAPGRHTLRLLFGDYLHIPHDPPVYSGTITIHVRE